MNQLNSKDTRTHSNHTFVQDTSEYSGGLAGAQAASTVVVNLPGGHVAALTVGFLQGVDATHTVHEL